MDLSGLDDSLLGTFWERQAQQQKQQKQQGQVMLGRPLLPAFSDRLLVFHRGVGVATAPGLYLNQKLDLLLDYLLVQPFERLASTVGHRWSKLFAGLNQQQQQQQHTVSRYQQGRVMCSVRSAQVSSTPHSSAAGLDSSDASKCSADGDLALSSLDSARVLANSGDLNHPATRVVVRRSLRSMMPTAKDVIHRFWERLVLQVHQTRTACGAAAHMVAS